MHPENRQIAKLVCFSFALTAVICVSLVAAERPNVLWIHAEDMSPLVSCYGVENPTPALDRLAEQGVLFERCYTPTPVCSTCRSSLMVGAYATSFGLHNHRSSRTAESAIRLPDGVKTLPRLMRDAGYYTFNIGGKLDFNFVFDPTEMFDHVGRRGFYRPGIGLPWNERGDGQPFFGMVQLAGGKNNRPAQSPTDPADVKLPAYYPDHPVLREFFAYQYDCAKVMDNDVKSILDRLEADGLAENTVVIFHTDHGMRCLRDKQFCYDGGLHVPMIIRWPANESLVPPGARRSEIVANLDVTATTLAVAGIAIPDWMECRPLFGDAYQPREYVLGVRDRCDFTIDRIRTVRTDRYRYVRNFLTDRPYAQPTYKDDNPQNRPGGTFYYVTIMRQLFRQGKLNARQAWFMAEERPAEELYDHETDPDETVNLATDPQYARVLAEHRTILHQWIRRTDDKGQYPESEAGLKAVLAQWGAKCINPEYEPVKKRFPELLEKR